MRKEYDIADKQASRTLSRLLAEQRQAAAEMRGGRSVA